MKVFKTLLVLTLGFSLFLISCSDETGPPAEVVAAFSAVRDAALGPVSTALLSEGTSGAIIWDNDNGLSYEGTLAITGSGDDFHREYTDLVITAVSISHSGYTISGTIYMAMSVDISSGDVTGGTLTLETSGVESLDLTGGEIATITLKDVTVNMDYGKATSGTITFNGVAYPASDFSFMPGT